MTDRYLIHPKCVSDRFSVSIRNILDQLNLHIGKVSERSGLESEGTCIALLFGTESKIL